MSGYIQTAIGIFISIALFLIGYRQTIGARRERIGSANRAVYKSLLRRLVLEDYSPKIDDIHRLIDGKAREFKVGPGDLHASEPLLNQVFAEIFDNDFIAPVKRIEIEKRLAATLDQLAKGRQKTDETQLINFDQRKQRFLLLLGILASFIGALVSLVLMNGGTSLHYGAGPDLLSILFPVFSVFVTSLVSVIIISYFKKAREAPDEAQSRVNYVVESAQLEHQVAAILTKLRIPFQIEPKVGLLRPDFVAEIGGKRVAIEVKSWRTPPPLSIASRSARYMFEIVRNGDVSRALIVTRGKLPNLENIRDTENVEFLSIKDLEEWIRANIRV